MRERAGERESGRERARERARAPAVLLRRLCWQIPAPLQSLQLLLTQLFLQILVPLQCLHLLLLLMRTCSQILAPPQSLQMLLRQGCSPLQPPLCGELIPCLCLSLAGSPASYPGTSSPSAACCSSAATPTACSSRHFPRCFPCPHRSAATALRPTLAAASAARHVKSTRSPTLRRTMAPAMCNIPWRHGSRGGEPRSALDRNGRMM